MLLNWWPCNSRTVFPLNFLRSPANRVGTRWSSNSVTNSTQLSNRMRRPRPQINTLDPSRLTKGDYADLAQLTIVRLGCWNGLDYPLSEIRYAQTKPPGGKTKCVPFPQDARGFFYFHRPVPPPEANGLLSPLAGSLRFRVIPGNQPSPRLFKSGHDLPSILGTPWSFPLIALRSIQKYHPIYDLLRCEGLVKKEQVDEAACLIPPGLNFRTRSTVLDTVLDPFVFEFDHKDISMTILDHDTVRHLKVRRVTAQGDAISPYSGVGLVRFELLPNRKSNPTKPQLLGLRLVKFLHPPSPAAYNVQREGELVTTCNVESGKESLWTYDPSEKLTEGMIRMLTERYQR